MLPKVHSPRIIQPLTIMLAGLLLLSSCSSASSRTPLPNPTVTVGPMATAEPTEVPVSDGSITFSLDADQTAKSFKSETVPAVPAGENTPYWEILPAYTRVTLQEYPISSHRLQPQIFIYPLQALEKVNEDALQMVSLLQFLLQSHQEIETMPFLPLINAKQMVHTNIQYLDFENGRGLRYLTWFSQGIVPVNNGELVYTYQGITNDGKFYVSAVLPVNHPGLPADGVITGNEPLEFTIDYATYLTNTAKSLDLQAAHTFTPDLIQLDAMINSLEIK